jgi:hypothetical protein
MSCVGDNTLVQFVEGRLPGVMRSEVENHLAGCSSCRALVSELGRSSVVSAAAAPASTSLFPVGARISARYEVTRFIAAGGMGEVYEAVDRELGARIALKTMRPELAADPRALDRFKREIHLARKVTHPNVCRIFDFGVHTTGDGGQVPFLTMELLDGPTLSQHLSRVGRLAPRDAMPIIDQLTSALEAAHEAGVVHRDFKPANVVLLDTRSGGWKAVVTDFGVARAFDGDDLAATHTGARGLVGSPAYMAPEQVEGRPAGPPADLYGLGVVLFEMVTGTLPFESDSPLMTALIRLEQPPPSPRSRVADLDERWERTILRCLARDAAERPGSAREVFLSLTSSVRTIAPTVPPMAGLRATRRAWPYAVAAAIVVVVAAVMLWPRQQRVSIDWAPAQAAPQKAPPKAAEAPPPSLTKSVIIRSEPPGALVLVDDQPIATTPAVIPLRLPQSVTLQLDGYQPQKQVVESAGEITLRLVPLRQAKKAVHPKRLLDE